MPHVFVILRFQSDEARPVLLDLTSDLLHCFSELTFFYKKVIYVVLFLFFFLPGWFSDSCVRRECVCYVDRVGIVGADAAVDCGKQKTMIRVRLLGTDHHYDPSESETHLLVQIDGMLCDWLGCAGSGSDVALGRIKHLFSFFLSVGC
jgi:hypothetical protein